jgi:hypothetical protein
VTRSDFIERHRHELSGMVLDAATTQAKGAELSLLLRGLLRKVDLKLGAMYDSLAAKAEAPPAPVPPARQNVVPPRNGAHLTERKE